jgi:hypothetical protein
MSRKRRKTPAAAMKPPAGDPLYGIQQAASMTECTGILPAQAENPEEQRSIAELGAIHPADDE